MQTSPGVGRKSPALILAIASCIWSVQSVSVLAVALATTIEAGQQALAMRTSFGSLAVAAIVWTFADITAVRARAFVWFVTIGALGIWHIADEPSIVRVFLPTYGISFLATHGVTGLFVLGAVFLTVTGAEALTADMGHFGKLPIRIGWFFLVFPALALNYLGQGAFALAKLEDAARQGIPFVN